MQKRTKGIKDEKVEEKDKQELLAEEILLIVNPNIKDCASWMVGKLPDYFFTVPASSTGKYHPKYALGEGGLLRHTKAACSIANTLLMTTTFGGGFSRIQKDMIILALIIHDGLKHDMPKQKYTVKHHPMLIRPYFNKCIKDDGFTEATPFFISDAQLGVIYSLIETHMGEWNKTDLASMPLPLSNGQKFVHLCDYLASRKTLEFNFDL